MGTSEWGLAADIGENIFAYPGKSLQAGAVSL